MIKLVCVCVSLRTCMLLHTIRNALSKHSLIRAKAEEKDLDSANDKEGGEVKKKKEKQPSELDAVK